MQRIIARAGRLARVFLLLTLPAAAQVISLGSSGGTVLATDACWSGGALFSTVPVTPPAAAGTLRYGALFSCTIPIGTGIPWLITFHFVEPCGLGAGCSATVTAGQRKFSVTINDTPALVDVDIFANVGALVELQRSVLVWPSSTNTLRIVFTSSVRTAVVSSIDYNTVALPQMWQNNVGPVASNWYDPKNPTEWYQTAGGR